MPRTQPLDSPPPARLFSDAGDALCHLVAGVPPDGWDRPGLGEWTVRDLVGHTSRALSTVPEYLATEPPADAREIPSAVAYFLFARTVDPSSVADRGRQAGRDLGDDPVAAVAAIRDRAVKAVETAPPGARVSLSFGATMALDRYLDTRIFELAVHCMDLARAIGVDAPASLGPSVTAAVELAGRVAARTEAAPAVLLALTGRAPLPADARVV